MIYKFCFSVTLTGFSLLATTAATQPAAVQPARPDSTSRRTAPDVTGWNKVTWGMTVAQAKKLFRAADVTEPESQPSGGRYPEVLVVNNIDVGGLPCTAGLETDRDTDSIAGVVIEPSEVNQEHPELRASAFDKLKGLLIQKYGKPKSDDRRQEDGNITNQVLWSFPSTTIKLKRSEGRYSTGFVLLMYNAVDKKALDVL